MLDYTIHVADSLHIQVDMVLGTGWPYGGSHVTLPHAATKLIVEKYPLKKNETFDRKIEISDTKEKNPAAFIRGSLWKQRNLCKPDRSRKRKSPQMESKKNRLHPVRRF